MKSGIDSATSLLSAPKHQEEWQRCDPRLSVSVGRKLVLYVSILFSHHDITIILELMEYYLAIGHKIRTSKNDCVSL